MTDTSTRPAFRTTDPATLAAGRTYSGHSADDAAAMAERAATAQRDWRRTSFEQRAVPMKKAASLLRARREELAALMTAEMGKTVTDGMAEVDKCATACERFADRAASYLAREPVAIEGARPSSPTTRSASCWP